MNRFSRVRHHVTVEDVKKKHLEKIAVENFEQTEKEITKLIAGKFKHDWRKELTEGMTTANVMTVPLPAEGDTAIDQFSPTDAASFAGTNNMFGGGLDNPALDGTTIRANGTGSGAGGGFNVGGEYLAFQGNGSGGSRMALLKPMDATRIDTLSITAIRGNSANGGEEADIVGQEELFLIYKTPDMSRSSYISQDRNQNNVGSFPADAAIIAIGQGDGTLQNYSITIPEYARQKDVIFGLFQLSHSGAGFDHYGITDIKFQRRTPLNVVVPLDSPEAISFVRVGTDEGDPKKRKKKVNDQLAASDAYTANQMGGEFPGQGTRIDGEDPYKSAEVQDVAEPSPIGKDEVTKTFSDFQTQTGQPGKTGSTYQAGDARQVPVGSTPGPDAQFQPVPVGTPPGPDAQYQPVPVGVPPGPDAQYQPVPIGSRPGPDAQYQPLPKPKTLSNFQKTPEQIKAQSDEYFADIDNVLTQNEYDFGDERILNITDKILELDPKNIDAYFYKSAYFDYVGDFPRAAAVADELVKNNPDNPDGYALRSYYREESGDLAGAIEDIEKTIELDPESEYIGYYEMELSDLKFQEAEVESNNAEKDRIESEAAAIQEKAHKDYWDSPVDLNTNFVSEEQQQQIDTNLEQAKDLLSTTHYNFGRGGWNTKGAIPLLQEILPLDPNNTEILSNLGVAMILGGSTSKGQQYLEKAQSLDPNIKFDFGINTWDRYDGEETKPFAGARIDKLSYMPHRYAREIIKNLPDQSSAQGATYGATDRFYAKDYGGSYTKYYTDKAKALSTRKLQAALVSAARQIEDNKYWMRNAYNNTSGSRRSARISFNELFGFMQAGMDGMFSGAVPEDVREKLKDMREALDKKISDNNAIMRNPKNYIPQPNAAYNQAYAFNIEGGWKNSTEYQYDLDHRFIPYARSAAFGLNNIVRSDVEEYQAYYKEYMSREVGELPEAPVEETPTLYGWMEDTYDQEGIKQEIQELGYDKQYKDLMTAWDSADKFSKFITPLKNLSDAMLGSKTAQNAKYENYKIAIAKSIMLNKPIRVNPDTIDPALIKKLGDRITPNQILSYDEEQRFKKMQEITGKLAKEGKINPTLVYDYDQPLATDGIPLIPIVSEPVPYADENIYEDEFGRVFTNDGSVANTTMQPDRAYHGFASAYKAEILRTNPIAGRGQAQYQIVVPPDGSMPYLLYKDHAYHNVKSADEGEVPGFMNKGAAGFVNWLGNTAHARSDGDANTGGMAGYPPNIRGDVITEFRIPITDLSKEVAEAIYRHPLMTEQPELVQVLKDKFYTDEYIKTFNYDDDPTGKKGKNMHTFYNDVILKRADQLKDFVTDNRLELVLRGFGMLEEVLPEGMGGNLMGDIGDMRTASNMLQKYDDYIQQTQYSPDGKFGYVPGFTNADGSTVDDGNRVDLTDAITKRSRDFLTSLLSSEDVEKEVRKYVNSGKTVSAKKKLENFLDGLTSNRYNLNFGLRNSIGGGTVVDIDEFLNGRLVLKKNYQFRDDDNIEYKINFNWWNEKPTAKQLAFSAQRGMTPVPSAEFDIAKNMTKLWDVSNDTWPDGAPTKIQPLVAVMTMTAARQLLHPVQAPGQSFASAMNVAPTMPYKIQLDVSEKIMKILQGIEDKSREEEDLGVSATDAATLAAERRRKRNRNRVNESNLFEKIKSKPFFNPKDIKPTFPENPPPEIDKKTGMHPNYGKQAKRYRKLDPMSANAMPVQGDPEIDAVVDKQRTKKKPSERRQDYIKTVSKIKKMAKGV